MRFNDKELAEISLGDAELEGRLNYRKYPSGNFNQGSGGKKTKNQYIVLSFPSSKFINYFNTFVY